MSEYSIVTFLEALADDELEEEMIKLICEGLADESLLEKLLETIGRKKK